MSRPLLAHRSTRSTLTATGRDALAAARPAHAEALVRALEAAAGTEESLAGLLESLPEVRPARVREHDSPTLFAVARPSRTGGGPHRVAQDPALSGGSTGSNPVGGADFNAGAVMR